MDFQSIISTGELIYASKARSQASYKWENEDKHLRKWPVKEYNCDVSYYKSFPLDIIDIVFCKTLFDLPDRATSCINLATILGFNVFDDFDSIEKHYKDSAEIEIFEYHLTLILKWGLFELDKSNVDKEYIKNECNVRLTSLGVKCLNDNCKYQFYSGFKVLYENEYKTDSQKENILFPFYKALGVHTEIKYSSILSYEKIVDLEFIFNPCDIDIIKKHNLQSIEILNIYASSSKQFLPNTIDVDIKIYSKDNQYFPIVFFENQICIEATEIINNKENKRHKEIKIEWGLYLKLLNDPDAVLDYRSLKPFLDLLVIDNIIEDARFAWHDNELFNYIASQASANQWSKISRICPTIILIHHLSPFKDKLEWNTLTSRFDNEFILQNPISFPWNYELLINKPNISVEDIKALLLNKNLRDISEFHEIDAESKNDEFLKTRYIEWDWDFIMPLLDNDFILLHIGEINFDLSSFTERLDFNQYDYVINYSEKRWNWNYISNNYDLAFILENICIIAQYLNLRTVCDRAFTQVEYVSPFCLSSDFTRIIKMAENPSLNGFSANQSDYHWSDLLINTLNQVGLIKWESTGYTLGFECNPYLIWDKDFFDKYFQNIKTDQGFSHVSNVINDLNIINSYPDFTWDWEILSSNIVFNSNILFLEKYKEKVSLFEILNSVSWETIERIFDSLNVLAFLNNNKNLWDRITEIASKDFILEHLDYDWNWSILTHRFCNDINIKSLGNPKWIDKWDWEYLSNHLDLILIQENLNVYTHYWFWDIISTRLSSEFISQNIQLYKDYWNWKIIAKRLNSEFVCQNLSSYQEYWDWNYFSMNLSIECIQDNIDKCLQFWDWRIITERLSPKFIVKSLIKYREYWDWETVVNNKLEEDNIIQEGILQNLAQCFILLSEDLRDSYWSTITRKISINKLEKLIANTYDLSEYFWDYKYLYDHRHFNGKKYIIDSTQYINWTEFSKSNAANLMFVFDKGIYSKKTWINRIVTKILNNPSYYWDYKELSKLSEINANHEIFTINKGNWDWEYISEFGTCLSKSTNFDVNFSLLEENINCALLSKRSDTGITESFLEQHFEKNWDWNALVNNPSIVFSFKFILAHIDKPWNWTTLSSRNDLECKIVSENSNIDWNWEALSYNSDLILSEEFIIKFFDKSFDWFFLSKNLSFIPSDSVLSIIHDKLNLLDWHLISQNINEDILTVEYLLKYKHQLYWPEINKKIGTKVSNVHLDKLFDVLDWTVISKSHALDFTSTLIDNYRQYWDWSELKKNPKVNYLGLLTDKYKSELNCATFIEKFPNYITPKIYHFTHLFNAIDVIKNRKILSRDKAKELGLLKYDAAGNVVERSSKAHTYARFYFRPQTLTQYYNEALGADSYHGENGWEFGGYDYNGKKIWKTKWKSKYPKALSLGLPKCPIPVFFKFDLKEVLTKMPNKCNYSTGNMQSDWAIVEKVTNNPNEINTEYLYSTINDGLDIYKKYSQQEFLIDEDFDFSKLNHFEIICYNYDYANLLKAQLGDDPICEKINANGWDIFHRSNRELILHENDNEISITSEYHDDAYLSIRGKGLKNIKITNPETIKKETESEIIAYPEIKFLKPDEPIEVHFVDTTIGKRDWLIYSSSLVSPLPNQSSNAEFKISEDIISCFEQLENLLKLKLSKELFHSNMIDSYHGIAHTTRVLFGTFLLVNYIDNLQENVKLATYYAAIIHDLGKTSDREGSTHGEASSFLYHDKIKEYITDTNLSNETLDAIKYHSIDDWSCPMEVRNSIIWKILKDADALDRGRFNRKCDRSYLRLDIFKTELGSQIIDFLDRLPNQTQNLLWDDPFTELINCLKNSNL